VLHSLPGTEAGDYSEVAAGWMAAVMSGIDRLWIGVPIFFVISGYCISATADSSRRKGTPVITYFYRRWRRIFPPYWIFLGIAAAYILATTDSEMLNLVDGRRINNPADLGLTGWLGNLTLTETWLPNLSGGNPKFIMGHAWTLCYEEQFYIITGLILLLAPRRFFAASLLVTGLTICGYVGLPRLGISIRGTFIDGSWIAFAAGIWVYYFRNYLRPGRQVFAWCLAAGAFAWVCRHPAALLVNDRHYSHEAFLFSALVFAVLIAIASPFDSRFAAARITQPIAWCGKMCYSLYLVHLPVVIAVERLGAFLGLRSFESNLFVVAPACLLASLVAARIFHNFVERRFMNAPQKVELRAARQESCCGAAGVQG
jgi:peptidoglycan/LPS O-acetylase OafA/YrhL